MSKSNEAWVSPKSIIAPARRVFSAPDAARVMELRGHKIQTELTQLCGDESIYDTRRAIYEEKGRLEDLQIKLGLQLSDLPLILDGHDTSLDQFLCDWAWDTEEYQSLFDGRLDDSRHCRVLWVSGPPGLGKTMLLKATKERLLQHVNTRRDNENFNVVGFFCSSRSQQQHDVVYLIKDLILQILQLQPHLEGYLEEKLTSTNRKAFNDGNNFYAMSMILYSMLDDSEFKLTYVVLDAIEEICVDMIHSDATLQDLLNLIVKTSELSPRLRWVVSFDPAKVDTPLPPSNESTQLRLGLDDPRYHHNLQKVVDKEQITDLMLKMAPHNFLWIDIACSLIKSDGIPWHAQSIVENLPKDVPMLYQEIDNGLKKLTDSDRNWCYDVLYTTVVAFRSLHISEITSLISLPPYIDLTLLVNKFCPQFIRISKGYVTFVHPSARDYIRNCLIASNTMSSKHLLMAKRCLAKASAMNRENVNTYAITSWMLHLCGLSDANDIDGGIKVSNEFLDNSLMEWVETVASLGLLSRVIVLLQRLHRFLLSADIDHSKSTNIEGLLSKACDVMYFLEFHRSLKAPSAHSLKCSLPFLPSASEVRRSLLPKAFPWLDIAPKIESSSEMAIYNLKGHDNWVRCCAYSPNGQLIASGGDDGTVRLWDAETASLQHMFYVDSYVYRILFTDQFLFALSRSAIYIWNVFTGKNVRSLSASDYGPLRDMSFSPVEQKLVATTRDHVIIWEVPPDLKLGIWIEKTLDQDTTDQIGVATSVAFSRHGSFLAYSLSSKIIVWNSKTNKRHLYFEGHENTICALDFWPDSKLLASGSDDGTLRIWSTNIGETRSLYTIREGLADVTCLAVSSDGLRLASGSSDSDIRIWKVIHEESGYGLSCILERKLSGHGRMIFSVAFAPQSHRLVSSSKDRTVRIWDTDTTEQWRMEPHNQVDRADQQQVDTHTIEEHTEPINFIIFSPRRNPPKKEIFASASDNQICLWSADTGKFITCLGQHDDDILSLAFSQNGDTLVSTSEDYTVCVWDVDSYKMKCRLSGHRDWVRCAEISPDGHFVASGSDDCSVRVWDITHHVHKELPIGTDVESRTHADDDPDAESEENKHVRIFSAHEDYVHCVAFSSSGCYLASGGDDRRIMIWNLQNEEGNQREAKSVLHHSSPQKRIQSLAFTEDEARILSLDTHGTIKLWDLRTEFCQKVLQSGERFIQTIRFDSRFPGVLITNIGAWPVSIEEQPPAETTDNASARTIFCELTRQSPPKSYPFVVSSDRNWITWNNKNLIFLPSQYQVENPDLITCRVWDNKVIIGIGSRRVLFFKFSKDMDLKL